MSSIKITLPRDVSATNPIVGDLFVPVRLTQTLEEEVAQQLFVRFRFFQGEWFLDPSQGTPWRQSILGKKQPLSIAAQILKRVVTSCPGVRSLLAFSIQLDSKRRAFVIFKARLLNGKILTSTDYGPFVVGGA